MGAAVVLVLLLAEPALAGEVDLSVDVRTARATTFVPTKYFAYVGGGGSAIREAQPGSDGTTPVTLALHVQTSTAFSLSTPFGIFPVSVAEDGTLSVPAGSPLSVSGSTLTLENDTDLPDFGVRMRRTTTLHSVEMRPVAVANAPASGAAPEAELLDGAQADAGLRWPLVGLVPGMRIRVNTTVGARFEVTVGATGGLAQDADPEALPVSTEAADPQVLVIENTIDLPDFAMRLAKPTTAVSVWYHVVTSWEHFARFPGPPELPVHPTNKGITYYPGPTAHTDAVPFPLVGLAPNQALLVGSVYGGESYRVQADGSLQQDTTGSRIAFDGDTAVVQNLLDIPDFRLRHQNPVNAELVHFTCSIYGTPGNAIPMSEDSLRPIPGADADDGTTFPLMGVVPGLVFTAGTPIGGLFFKANEQGQLEIVNPLSPPAAEIVDSPEANARMEAILRGAGACLKGAIAAAVARERTPRGTDLATHLVRDPTLDAPGRVALCWTRRPTSRRRSRWPGSRTTRPRPPSCVAPRAWRCARSGRGTGVDRPAGSGANGQPAGRAQARRAEGLASPGVRHSARVPHGVAMQGRSGAGRGTIVRISPDIRDAETSADLADQRVGDLRVARNGFDVTVLRIRPEGVSAALPLEGATVHA